MNDIISAPVALLSCIKSCFILGLLGFFCPLIHECILSSDAGECCCVASCCPVALRTKIRTRHNIAVKSGNTFLIRQETRLVKKRLSSVLEFIGPIEQLDRAIQYK